MFRFVLAVAFVFSFGAFAQDSTLLDDAIFQMRKYPTTEPIVGLLILESGHESAYGLAPTLVPRDTLHLSFMGLPAQEATALWGGSKEDLADARSLTKIENFAQRHKFGLVVFSPSFQAPDQNLSHVRHFIKSGRFQTRPARTSVDDISILIDTKADKILGASLTAAQLLAAAERPVERIGSHTLLILKRSELAKMLPKEDSCNKVLSRHETFNPFDHFLMHP